MIERPRQSFQLNLSYRQYQLNSSTLENLTVGDYKVIKELGRGSFGKVYKAIDERGAQFALKLLDKKRAREDKNSRTKEIRQKLIESQSKLMQQCNSPNVIKCFDIYQNEDLKILIIEYCNGKTLTDELKQKKRFTQREAVDILRHIINGVAELHRNSIVHRNLKTDNIMKHDGVYKIIDFGFSKKLLLSYQHENSKNTILGTPTNMAPQVVYRKNYGLKADIWSIGVIFFQLVFGVTPYDLSKAGNFFKEIEKIFAKIEPIFYQDANLSPQGQDFLRRVLKINPDERMGWREMIQHPLTKIKDQQPLTSRFIQRYNLVEPQVSKQLSEGSLIDRQESVKSSFQNKVEEIKSQVQSQVVTVQPFLRKTRKEIQQNPSVQKAVVKEKSIEIIEIQIPKQQVQGSLDERRFQQLTVRSLLPKNSQIKDVRSITQRKQQEQSKFKKQSQNPPSMINPKKQRFNLDQLIQLDKQEQLKKSKIHEKPPMPMYSQQSQIRNQGQSKSNQKKQLLIYQQIENSMFQQQSPEYKKCLAYHLECLKTQLLYEKIIEPIQTRNLLDLTERESIQFMYLLISRCFKNLSPLKQILKNTQNLHSSFYNLNFQIQRLYNKVALKFKQYDQRLLELENYLFQRAKDFFLNIFSRDEEKQKDRIISGVEIYQLEKGKVFGDFTKNEQIEFTSKYIERILPNMLDIGSYTLKIKKYLQFYSVIMNVTLQKLGDQSFSGYVQRIIS